MPITRPPAVETRFYKQAECKPEGAAPRCIDMTDLAFPARRHAGASPTVLLEGAGAAGRPLTDLWEWIAGCASLSSLLLELVHRADQQGWRMVFEPRDDANPIMIDRSAQMIRVCGHGLPPTALLRHSFYRWDYLDRVIEALRTATQAGSSPEMIHDFPSQSPRHTDHAGLLCVRHERADRAVMRALIYGQMRERGEQAGWRYRLGTQESDLALALMQFRASHDLSLQAGFLYPLWFCQRERLILADRAYCQARLQDSALRECWSQNRNTLEDWLLSHSVLPGQTHSYLKEMIADLVSNPHYATPEDTGCRDVLASLMDQTREPAPPPVLRFRDSGLERRLFGGE